MVRTTVVLQEPTYLAVDGSLELADYTQPQRHWVAVGGANAVQVLFRVLDLSNCKLNIESGPLLDAPFSRLSGLANLGRNAGGQVVVLPDAVSPLSNYLRWSVIPDSPTSSWSIQFEVYATLYTV